MDIFKFVIITPELTDKFSTLIPLSLAEELHTGRLLGIGSVTDSMPTGALIFNLEGHHARICSLYIDQDYRRRGIGSGLVDQLLCIVRKVGGVYSVRAVIPESEEGILSFFESMGAGLEQSGESLSFSVSQLKDNALMKIERTPLCVSGMQLEKYKLNDYMHKLEKAGDYLMENRLTDSKVRQDLSQYYVKDDIINGCAVITEDNGVFCLALLASQGKVDVPPMLLSALCHKLVETLPPETEIFLEAVTPETKRLSERLLPKAKRNAKAIAVLKV